MDIIDERDLLEQRRDVLLHVVATGRWSDGTENVEPEFALMAYQTAMDMLAWNEPVLLDEWRDLVTQRYAEFRANMRDRS